MKIFRYVCFALLGAVFCGCGDKQESGAGHNDSTLSGQPKVVEGTKYVLLYRDCDREVVKSVWELISDLLEEDLPEEVWSEYEKFLEGAGMKGNRCDWAVLSVNDIPSWKDLNKGNFQFVSGSAVIKIKHDSEGYLDCLLDLCDRFCAGAEDIVCKEVEISGVKTLVLRIREGRRLYEFYTAGLGGEFIVFSSNRFDFKQQIGLYRDGKPGEEKFRDFLGDNDCLVGFAAVDIDESLKSAEEEFGEKLPRKTPFGRVNLKNCKNFRCVVRAGSEGFKVFAAVSADSEKDAEDLARVLKNIYRKGCEELVREKSRGCNLEESDIALEILDTADIVVRGSEASVSLRVTRKMLERIIRKISQEML